MRQLRRRRFVEPDTVSSERLWKKHHLVLHRRDPEQGVARFYSLMIERPTLPAWDTGSRPDEAAIVQIGRHLDIVRPDLSVHNHTLYTTVVRGDEVRVVSQAVAG